MIELTLPVPPSGNRYWRHVGPRVVRAEEARRYIADVSSRCAVARIKPIAGNVAVSVIWYRAKRVGDLDNRLKVLLDALSGHAYRDDAKVVRLFAEMRDTEPCNPRVEIAIMSAEEKPRGVGA